MDELAWCEPWPKFLCIKGVVFMTFWQGLAISAMSGLGLVDDHMASTAQDFLICVEMLLASLAHFWIFPYQQWQDGYKEKAVVTKAAQTQLRDTLALRDFMRDIQTAFAPAGLADDMDEDAEAADMDSLAADMVSSNR